jgi:hypothetical protein
MKHEETRITCQILQCTFSATKPIPPSTAHEEPLQGNVWRPIPSLGSHAFSLGPIRPFPCALSLMIRTLIDSYHHVSIILIFASARQRSHSFCHTHPHVINGISELICSATQCSSALVLFALFSRP